MLSDLENYVLKLHECLVDASSAGELPRSIISDIVYKCGENISQQTICKYDFYLIEYDSNRDI